MTRMYGGEAGRARGGGGILVRGRHDCIRRWCSACAGLADLGGRRLGDHHHRRAQQPAVQRPGRGPGVHHAARRDGPSLSCSAIAWCRLGSNGGAGRILALDAVALQGGQEVALDAFQALAQTGDDRGLAHRWAAAGSRSRGAGCRPPPPRPGRISARRIGGSRSPRDATGHGRWPFRPRPASSGPSSPAAPPPVRRCGRWRPASPAPASAAGRARRCCWLGDRGSLDRFHCSWRDQLGGRCAADKRLDAADSGAPSV